MGSGLRSTVITLVAEARERMSQVLRSCFRGLCGYIAETIGGWRGGYPIDQKKDQDADDSFPSIERSISSNAVSMISPAMTCAVLAMVATL